MRGEIDAQPFFLRRTGLAAADILALTVQHDDVPSSELIAVVAGLWIARSCAKIIKVRSCSGRMKLMIPGRRPGARLSAPPGFVVADEIFLAAVGISEITDRHNRAGNLIEQFCGGFRARGGGAIGNVE